MTFYDVQVTTDLGEVVVLQICAFSAGEAELTAISMVENGDAGVLALQLSVVLCCSCCMVVCGAPTVRHGAP